MTRCVKCRHDGMILCPDKKTILCTWCGNRVEKYDENSSPDMDWLDVEEIA